MKAVLEHVQVESLAEFGMPEVSVKYTAAEWQLMRKFTRIAKEHLDIIESDLSPYEQIVYKKMVPFFMEIDEQIAKSLEDIRSKNEDINMDAVKDFHRYDWTEELAKNVATDEEIAAMRKEEEEAIAAAAAQAPPQTTP
jgi:hypothetical protein